MAVIATDQCTLSVAVDVESVETWYMQVAASANAPAKPTVADPSSLGWTTTEPGFDAQNSKKLYTCQKTTLTDGTFMWGAVQLSSSYTGASTALNTANAAASAVAQVQTLVRQYGQGVLVCKTGQTVGALVNADGSFDVVNVTWSNGTPTAGTTLATFGSQAVIGQAGSSRMYLNSNSMVLVDECGLSLLDIEDYNYQYSDYDYFRKDFTIGTRGNVGTRGQFSVAIGNSNDAAGDASTAIGEANTASGTYSLSAGDYNTASGNWSTAVGGYQNISSGDFSFSSGRENTASGNGSVALGYGSAASGMGSFALGTSATASEYGEFALGNHVDTGGYAQFVVGQYNVIPTGPGNAMQFVVGNGTADNARSNAFSVDPYGNVVAAGTITSQATQTANRVLAGPSSGSAAAPTWRALAAADLPVVTLAKGGTGGSNTSRAINTVFAGPSSGSAGNASFRKLVAADIPDLSGSYLPLSGGTLTGNVTMDHKYIYLDASDVDIANPPTSGVAGNARIQLRDKNDNIVAQLIPYISNAGRYGAQFGTAGNWLYITTDGTNPYVAMTNAAAWRTGLGLGSIATAGAATYLKRQPASGELASTTNTGVFPIVLSDSFANSGVVSYMSQANFRTALDLQQQDDYYAASSATQVNVANTSLYRFLVILFRTNSATYTGGGTSAATSPLNSTVVHVNKKSSGSVYVSLLGGHALSGTSVQIRTGLATITCSATAGKVVLSNQRYINLGNGASGTQEVGTQTDMALVGVIGIY